MLQRVVVQPGKAYRTSEPARRTDVTRSLLRSPPQLLQHVVRDRQHLAERLRRVVAEVADAEALALQLGVAVRELVAALEHLRDEGDQVDVAADAIAGRGRAVLLRHEALEPL